MPTNIHPNWVVWHSRSLWKSYKATRYLEKSADILREAPHYWRRSERGFDLKFSGQIWLIANMILYHHGGLKLMKQMILTQTLRCYRSWKSIFHRYTGVFVVRWSLQAPHHLLRLGQYHHSFLVVQDEQSFKLLASKVTCSLFIFRSTVWMLLGPCGCLCRRHAGKHPLISMVNLSQSNACIISENMS